MAAPWSTSTKSIDVTASMGAPPTTAFSTGFVPPPVPDVLLTSPIPMFAAIAKMQALRMAPASITAALGRAATALTEAIVDDASADFQLVADAEDIEATARTALAGSVGAGACHLVMVSMRYVWHDHAHKLIPASPLADFAYDGGPATGHGLVLAEAKGSFSKKVTRTWVKATSEAAYDRQVFPHVPRASGSPAVVHGYAVKLGAELASVCTPPGPHSFIHVTETPTGTPSPKPSFNVTPTGESASAVTSVALGDYRAAFMLVDAPVVMQCIDFLRGGDGPTDEREQFFDVLSTESGDFIAGASIAGDHRSSFGIGGRRFAIRKDVASTFLTNLSQLLVSRAPLPDRLVLPVVPYSGDGFYNDFVFPDGFSLVASRAPFGTARWSAAGGFVG